MIEEPSNTQPESENSTPDERPALWRGTQEVNVTGEIYERKGKEYIRLADGREVAADEIEELGRVGSSPGVSRPSMETESKVDAPIINEGEDSASQETLEPEAEIPPAVNEEVARFKFTNGQSVRHQVRGEYQNGWIVDGFKETFCGIYVIVSKDKEVHFVPQDKLLDEQPKTERDKAAGTGEESQEEPEEKFKFEVGQRINVTSVIGDEEAWQITSAQKEGNGNIYYDVADSAGRAKGRIKEEDLENFIIAPKEATDASADVTEEQEESVSDYQFKVDQTVRIFNQVTKMLEEWKIIKRWQGKSEPLYVVRDPANLSKDETKDRLFRQSTLERWQSKESVTKNQNEPENSKDHELEASESDTQETKIATDTEELEEKLPEYKEIEKRIEYLKGKIGKPSGWERTIKFFKERSKRTQTILGIGQVAIIFSVVLIGPEIVVGAPTLAVLKSGDVIRKINRKRWHKKLQNLESQLKNPSS